MTTQTITRPSPLRRLASFSQRHHWTALLLWVVVLVGVTGRIELDSRHGKHHARSHPRAIERLITANSP